MQERVSQRKEELQMLRSGLLFENGGVGGDKKLSKSDLVGPKI